MQSSLETLFSDVQYCYSELVRMIDIIHSDKFLENIEILHKELGIMLCYCPEIIINRIYVVLEEIRTRQFLLLNKE